MNAKDLCVVLRTSKGHLYAFKTGEIESVTVEFGRVTVEAEKDGMEIEMTVPLEKVEFIDIAEYERRGNAWGCR